MPSLASTILTDVANHYNRLVDQHRQLDKEITYWKEYGRYGELSALKKKKLQLKDEIEQLKNQLKLITN